jgi:microcystin-dependent protein
METIKIDGVEYNAASIPQHVYQLFDALDRAQKMQTEKQSELLIVNHAVASLAAQVRGAMSVIPPYVPPAPASAPEKEDAPEDVPQD